ncbi:oligosaccharide flippase family protein [Bacillus cereus]|uniref:oligosaccharide flippase family protein n=1 Tax=Bacillus cereus TaxID=1396 RepID=UPI003827C74F
MKVNELKMGALLSYISIFLSNIISLVYTPFLLRSLGAAEYGLYMLIGSIVGYLTILDFGFGNALTRYVAKFRDENNKKDEANVVATFLLLFGFIALLSIIVGWIVYLNLDVIFSNSLTATEVEKAKTMFLIMIFNIAISFPIQAFTAIMNGYEKFIILRIVRIITIVFVPLIMVPLLILGYKSLTIIVLNTVFNVLAGAINIYYVLVKLKVSIKLEKFNWSFIKEVSNYSFFIFLAIIVDQLFWRTGQLIVGLFHGTTVVAIFAIAMQICQYYMSFSTMIPGMLLARTTQMVNNNASGKELTDFFIKIGRIQFIILGFILIGFILFGSNFITIWAGENYEDAWLIIIIIMIPLTIHLFQNVGLPILQAKNMHAFRAIMYVIIAVINVCISIPLVKVMGGIGAAIGTSVAIIIGDVIIMNIYYHYKVQINIPQFFKEIVFMLPGMIVATGVGAATLLIQGNSFIIFVLRLAIFAVAYCSCLWFLSMNRYEKNLIKKPIINIITKLKSN